MSSNNEEFNGLLNALRRGNDVQPPQSNPWYISPNNATVLGGITQAQTQQQIPPLHPGTPIIYYPQQVPVPMMNNVNNKSNVENIKTTSTTTWLNFAIIILLLILISLGIIVWMRMTKLNAVKIDKEEEKEKVKDPATTIVKNENLLSNSEIRLNQKNEIRELPAPASLTPLYDAWPNDLNEEEQQQVSQLVTQNILDYVQQSKDIIDLKNEDVNFEELIPKKNQGKKRLVADESEEVLEYIKKRENLFKHDN